MNLKTTVVLVVLMLFGGLLWLGLRLARSGTPASASLAILEKELKPDQIRSIKIARGDRVVDLKHTGKGEWSLPGNWPTRAPEVKQVVDLLANLHTRFVPLPAKDKKELAKYGLDNPVITVVIHAGDKEYRLRFGEEPAAADANRFSRPTYLQVDDQNEVIRLAPGILSALDHPADYYQQRRLFPFERVKPGESGEGGERLAARSLDSAGKNGAYVLSRAGDDPQDSWNLSAPVKDRADPDKVKNILSAVPDIWAEQFVDKSKDLAECGLKDPEQTLTVTNQKGEKITLLVGKPSQMKVRTVSRPAPPNQFGLPQPPLTDTIHEEYRYAKLKDNDQVFEIKSDKLKDLTVAADALRDPRLARFRTEDANRIEIAHAGQDIVLVKEKDRWQLEKPMKKEAETAKVNELLDKLSMLEAKDKDIIDKADLKALGLEPPAGTVQVTVEESQGEGDKKTKKKKTFVFTVGKHDAGKSKLYVKVDKWERVNAVEEGLNKLVERSALAYRNRRVLDFTVGDLGKIEVERGGKKFSLEHVKDAWRLTAPEPADADPVKASQLAGDLGRLEAVEFVSDTPKPEELDAQYGLAKPALSVSIAFAKEDKKDKPKLLLGKQRGDKPEFFAKLEAEPAVFVVKKEIHDALDKGSLAFLRQQLWPERADVTELRLQKEGHEYVLKQDGKSWKISGPFEALALAGAVQPMVNALADPRSERYETHAAKELGAYGLDKPYLRLVLSLAGKKTEGDGKEKPKERVLLIGKPTAEGAKSRFAKLGDSEAVFVLGDKFVDAVDKNALDLLDRHLLSLDPRAVASIKMSDAQGTRTIERKEDFWVVDAPATKFTADSEVMNSLLSIWANLRAERCAAHGDKVDSAAYGLDKPSATITIALKKSEAADQKEPVPAATHVLLLGKAPDKEPEARFARLDNGPGVFVLPAQAVKELTRTAIELVDRTLLKFDAGRVNALDRRMGIEELELVKKPDGDWQLAKPATQKADEPAVAELLKQLANLRALRVADYQPKDLKPFGLDTPTAVLTLRLPDGDKSKQHVLKIGKAADKDGAAPSGDRFVMADDAAVVGVIPGPLTKSLLAGPLFFRDRNLAPRFADVDQIILEREPGPRKAVFTRVNGTWKMTSPVAAEAEQTQLEDFINDLTRLRADELVAEKPGDPVHGLDRPAARWQFRSGDKDVFGLLVGNREKTGTPAGESEGARAYAKSAGGDLVFLLSPKTTGQALEEYRGRSVWPPLDAVQVDALLFNYEGNPFELKKVDNAWTVVGRPERKIKAKEISDTLDALSRLRAERYVADKDGDRTLYGLNPPRLALEIRTPSGKRLLHIGRAEGASKRTYARVVDGERSEIFVLSATDAARILRDLGAFTETETKPAQ